MLQGTAPSDDPELLSTLGQAVVKSTCRGRGRVPAIQTAASARSRRETKPRDSFFHQVERVIGSRISKSTKSRKDKVKEQNNNPDAQALRARSDGTPDATSSSRMEIVQDSPLLSLPPEIRNEIWKFAVLTTEQLNILGSNPKQPPITRTCRQIRAESIRYFYRDNSFACTIMDYNPADFKQYRKFADKHGLSTVLLTHKHSTGVSRDVLRANFLAWAEGTFKGETAPLGYSAGHTEDTFVWEKLSHRIVKVFNVARHLKKMSVDWEDAKVVLLNTIDGAGVCGEKKR
jgi:hypothetical protein